MLGFTVFLSVAPTRVAIGPSFASVPSMSSGSSSAPVTSDSTARKSRTAGVTCTGRSCRAEPRDRVAQRRHRVLVVEHRAVPGAAVAR